MFWSFSLTALVIVVGTGLLLHNSYSKTKISDSEIEEIYERKKKRMEITAKHKKNNQSTQKYFEKLVKSN